jgi:hypothetical protein
MYEAYLRVGETYGYEIMTHRRAIVLPVMYPATGGMRFSVFAIVPAPDGKDYVSRQLLLDIAQDPFMATVYRTALIIALEEFFGRVQSFGDTLALAKYCQKEWPSERIDQIVASMVRNRGIN